MNLGVLCGGVWVVHPQHIRVMIIADAHESEGGSLRWGHPVWRTMRGCPGVYFKR